MNTSKNLFPHDHYVNASRRKELIKQKPLLIWLSGLSGSGKSTIANELEKKLFENGYLSYLLDGDNIRVGLNKDLGFSDEDRKGMLVLPEKRNPPQRRKSEREWAQENERRGDASVVQHWLTTEDFFYCHWLAKNERDIYKTLEGWGVEGVKFNSMVTEAYEYVTAFRNSDTVFRKT